MRKHLLVIVLYVAVIYACKHTVETPVIEEGGSGTGGSTGGGGSTSTLVCFEADILPIFRSSCAKSGCHNAASAQEGYVFESYSTIIRKGIKPGNANDSKVYKVLIEDDDDDDRMPLPPNPRLPAAQIALIKKVDQ